MKNKLLILSLAASMFIFAGAASAIVEEGIAEEDIVTAGNQYQSQVQTQAANQGGEPQMEEQAQVGASAGAGLGEQRRNRVSNAVREMLMVADRSGGIGEQVRVIAQNQNQNHEKLEASLEKIGKRGRVAKFFIGPNHGEIKSAEKMLEQNREEVRQLSQLQNQLENQGDQEQLRERIRELEQVHSEIENSLGESKKGFSLFGWLFKWFAR